MPSTSRTSPLDPDPLMQASAVDLQPQSLSSGTPREPTQQAVRPEPNTSYAQQEAILCEVGQLLTGPLESLRERSGLRVHL